jgi:uncharacterized nucleotidyltransferase DUF6036
VNDTSGSTQSHDSLALPSTPLPSETSKSRAGRVSRRKRARGLATPTRFDTDELVMLLDALDAELKARGQAASVYIVGGAAIAMTVMPTRRTADVDVITRQYEVVMDAARAVATAQNVNENWLNTSAAPWVPPRPLAARAEPTTLGLTRYFAPPEHLLAMKLVASRVPDEPDIRALVAELGLGSWSAEEFAALLARVYEGEGALAQALGVRDDDVDDEARHVGEQTVRLIADSTTGAT